MCKYLISKTVILMAAVRIDIYSVMTAGVLHCQQNHYTKLLQCTIISIIILLK